MERTQESSASLSLRRRLDQGEILILDGAMGTMIQAAHLSEDDFRGQRFAHHPTRLLGNNDLISLSRPDVLLHIHRSYLEAGADIICTNTFNAQRISQQEYGTTEAVVDINRAAACIARQAADEMTRRTPEKPRYVAASIGPTSKTLSMSPDVDNPAFRSLTYDELAAAYTEQMVPLLEEKVDLLLIETIFDTLNAKAALSAARAASGIVGRHVPVMLSATIADASGRTLSGQTIEAFLTSIAHDDQVVSVGLNCSFGADDMRPYLRLLATRAPYYISAHPNAGLPDEEGNYSHTPALMAEAVSRFADDGSINIVGGCCGSTPAHIAAIAATLHGRKGRKRPTEAHTDWLAGLEGFTPLPHTFTNVGERCNVAGSRKFLRLIKEKAYDEALGIARKQVRDGAMVLDINMDDGLLDTAQEMVHFLQLMASDPEVARIPWMIDSSRFQVIEAALKCVQGKAIVNSISLKEGEETFLAHARTIRSHGAAMVVMAFDEEGQATTYERKISICQRAYRLLTERAGIHPADIIFDPNILTVATGMKEHDRYALDFIEATAWIRQHMPGCHVSGGVSNLSFAFRGNNYLREAMHAAFLFHAMEAGMDMAIVNPSARLQYADIPPHLLELIDDVLLCRRQDATERLTEEAGRLMEAQDASTRTAEATPADRTVLPLTERLATALRQGDDEYLEADLQEALTAYPAPEAIIEGPLMEGMERVGELFGAGKMFLPQVIKSARTMKRAVAFLQPYLEAKKAAATETKGRYLMATVKGDVHDIGKNIVAVVMGCNGFEVDDLGVMVPAEHIVTRLQEGHYDFVGLSGLITPSLDEMCHTARAMEAAGLTLPLFVGGATTSPLHTALKIAPLYSGPVFHVKDAAQNPVLALALLGADRDKIIAENRLTQATLVRQHEAKKKAHDLMRQAETSSTKAKATTPPTDALPPGRLHIDWTQETLPRPTFTGLRTLRNLPLNEVRRLINWTYFYHFWRVRPHTAEAENVKQEAEALLDSLPNDCLQAQVAFCPAYATDHSIVLKPDHMNGDDTIELPTPRQQVSARPDGACLALCDFVAPQGYADYVGAFAITLSPTLRQKVEHARKGSDPYHAILLQSVCDRLAEAGSEWLHREVRRHLWGYAPDEHLSPEDLARAAYQGIRPAIGYPSLPDQSLIFKMAQLLRLDDIGIRLTENGAMYPQSSVCGLYLSSPHACYFNVVRD